MALTPIHPGEHLSEELGELGMSAVEFAQQIQVPDKCVTEVLGRAGVDHWRLGPETGPLFWNES